MDPTKQALSLGRSFAGSPTPLGFLVPKLSKVSFSCSAASVSANHHIETAGRFQHPEISDVFLPLISGFPIPMLISGSVSLRLISLIFVDCEIAAHSLGNRSCLHKQGDGFSSVLSL